MWEGPLVSNKGRKFVDQFKHYCCISKAVLWTILKIRSRAEWTWTSLNSFASRNAVLRHWIESSTVEWTMTGSKMKDKSSQNTRKVPSSQISYMLRPNMVIMKRATRRELKEKYIFSFLLVVRVKMTMFGWNALLICQLWIFTVFWLDLVCICGYLGNNVHEFSKKWQKDHCLCLSSVISNWEFNIKRNQSKAKETESYQLRKNWWWTCQEKIWTFSLKSEGNVARIQDRRFTCRAASRLDILRRMEWRVLTCCSMKDIRLAVNSV